MKKIILYKNDNFTVVDGECTKWKIKAVKLRKVRIHFFFLLVNLVSDLIKNTKQNCSKNTNETVP